MSDERKLTGIGQRIKNIREDKDMTQQSLGETIRVVKSVISKIEKGIQSPTLVQIEDIANALDVKIDYVLGIDKEADLIRDVINEFGKITTSKEYFANKDVYKIEDFIFETSEDYLVLTGNESLFVLIQEIAKAKNLQPKLSKKNYDTMIEGARKNYNKNKDNSKEGSYFLISGEQMTEIIESKVRARSQGEALLIETGVTAPLEGESLPELKLNRKKE